MKELYLAVTVAAALLCSSDTFADSAISPCKKHLKIGVSLPLSAGPISSGKAVMNSIILAGERYDPSNCVQFVFEDDQLLARNTVTNISKFLNVDAVDGLIVYGTPTSIAVGDMVEKAKRPMIALSISRKVVEGRSYIMKHWSTAERLSQAVTDEVKRRGYRHIAIISTQNDAMLGLRDLFVKGDSADVVLDDEYVRENFDFRSSVLKVISRGADAVYVLLYPPQTGLFVKQLREQGYKHDAFGVHNVEDPREVEASRGAMVGMWFANGDDSLGENYRADYLRRFNTETSLGGGSGFDSAKMFIEAAAQEGDVNQFLHHLKNFRGAFGTYNSTTDNDFDFNAVIKKITKDGFEKLSQ